MRLMSIEHDEENAMVSAGLNLFSIVKRIAPSSPLEIVNTAGVFWTSGRDVSGNGDFEWTAIKRSFNNFLNWAPGQPEVGMLMKFCAYFLNI
jgi:hypothetical protein